MPVSDTGRSRGSTYRANQNKYAKVIDVKVFACESLKLDGFGAVPTSPTKWFLVQLAIKLTEQNMSV